MDKFDDEVIKDIKTRFTKRPFHADRVKIVELERDFDLVLKYFEISPKNRCKLEHARSYLRHNWARGSIELSNEPSEQRLTLGLMPISQEKLLIWRKVEDIKEAERNKNYGIDGLCLDIAWRVVLPIIKPGVPQITGWTDEAVQSAIKIAIYPHEKAIKTMRLVFFLLMIEIVIAAFYIIWRVVL